MTSKRTSKLPQKKRAELAAALEVPEIPELSPDQKAAARDAYNRAVDSAELASVRLLRSSFIVLPSYFEMLSLPKDRRMLKFGLDGAQCEAEINSARAIGIFDWSVEARVSGDKEPRLRQECAYMVEYTGFNVLDAESVEATKAFVRRVGMFAAFPYVRALFGRMSDESGAGLPPLPLLKAGAVAAKGATVAPDRSPKRKRSK